MTGTTMDWPQETIAQCVSAVVRSRRSVRAFRPDPLPRQVVEAILDDAASAPSGANIQPWRVHVVSGTVKEELGLALVAASHAEAAPAPAHFPQPLPDACQARQTDFGARYYASLGIDRGDAAARARQTERNFSFFGAPVGLVFSIDRRLKRHSWVDLGLFAQNVMIAAKARGIDTCPQVAFAPFHDLIAQRLDMPAQEVTAFGMAMGYGIPEAPVNQTRMPRARVQDFARLAGFADCPIARTDRSANASCDRPGRVRIPGWPTSAPNLEKTLQRRIRTWEGNAPRSAFLAAEVSFELETPARRASCVAVLSYLRFRCKPVPRRQTA